MPITALLRWAEADGVFFDSVPLWSQPSGPQIRSPRSRSWPPRPHSCLLPASAPVRAGQGATGTRVPWPKPTARRLLSSRQEKCVDMGNIPLDTSEAKE
ncbi:hypothetical protein VZT92_005619 [Zoarces viviparus]|uniref:Uncharacterized protein n=1 Tax=Zoarces viviparus TaxID=48416 RepID=A0AAW1FWF6_ZOAVI